MTRAAAAACGHAGTAYGRGMCKNCYQTYRNRQIAYGRWDPAAPVAADAVRTHVEKMAAIGVGSSQLARLAGVDHETVCRIVGRDGVQVTERVRAALLAVQVPERATDVVAANAQVPMHGAQRRIRALIAFGYPRQDLARQLGMLPAASTMTALVNGHRDGREHTITAARDQSVRALFDRLELVPGPSDRARAKGRRNGWALPFEWDEDSIDDPHAKPSRARWTRTSATEERREQTAELTERGLSAAQIAERLGVTERTVQRDREAAKTSAGQPDPQIEAMGEVIVQARAELAAGRPTRTGAGRERTR